MKPIKCEICGSNDLIKHEGMFVCQHCGTKYTLDEARKLAGNVKIDHSNDVENLLTLARRAKAEGEFEKSKEYYEKVLEYDPNNPEARFCIYVFNVIYSSYGELVQRIQLLDGYLDECIMTVCTDNDVEYSNKIQTAYETIDVIDQLGDYIKAKFTIPGAILADSYSSLINLILLHYHTGDTCLKYLKKEERIVNSVVSIWKKTLLFHWDKYNTGWGNEYHKKLLEEYTVKVQEYDPSWAPWVVKPYTQADSNPSSQTTENAVKPNNNKYSLAKKIGIIFVIGMLINSCFSSPPNEVKVVKTDNPLTKKLASTAQSEKDNRITVPTGLEIITRQGSPKLFSNWEENVEFYKKDSQNLVSLKSSEYKETNVLHMNFAKKNQLRDEYTYLQDIQIYPSRFENGSSLSIKEALQIVDHFMPWDTLDKYSQLDTSTHYSSDKESSEYYVLGYSLQPRFRESPKAPNKGGVVTVVIKTDKQQKLSLIRILGHYYSPIGRLSNFQGKPWKPEGFHQLPPPEQIPDIKKEIKGQKVPKLLGHYGDLIIFAKIYGEEYCFLEHKDTRDKFGGKHKETILTGAGMRNDKLNTNYVFELSVDLDRLKPNTTSLVEAVELCDALLPKDIINKYYKVLFSRKKIRKQISKSDDTYAVYEVIYKLNLTSENRNEVIKHDYPENLRVVISQNYDKIITSFSVNAYRYIGEKSYDYEEGTTEKGERIEILKDIKEYGPYEDNPNSVYRKEYWNNPF